MPKRFFAALICIALVLSSGVCMAHDMGATFSINAIKQNTDSNRLVINITLPSVTENGTLMMCFYTGGVLTQTTTYDASKYSKFSSKTIKYISTPDEICLFLWDKGKLKPLSSSQSVLTEAVITAANTSVENLLSKVEATTDSIRELLMPDARAEDNEILGLLRAIDDCAIAAMNSDFGKNHLLTSQFCSQQFRSELIYVQTLYNNSSSAAQERLKDLYLNYVEDEYADVITDFMGFFDIKVNL